jgi:hypothetical protein
MHTQRENSTLIALREVRSLEGERRRKEQLQQEEEARRLVVQAEETSRAEWLAREAATREQSLAMQRREEARLREKEVLRLRKELSQQTIEITRLRQEGEALRRTLLDRSVRVAPPAPSANPIPWVAGAVVGVVALAMFWGPSKTSTVTTPMPPLAMSCPAPAVKTIPLPPPPTIQAPRSPVGEGRPKATPKTHRPIPPAPTQVVRPPECDGTDPLCGLDVQRISDEGKKPWGIR